MKDENEQTQLMHISFEVNKLKEEAAKRNVNPQVECNLGQTYMSPVRS